MARSVDYAQNYSAIAYQDISWMGQVENFTCENVECDQYEEETIDANDGDVCECCGKTLTKHTNYDDFIGQIEWNDFIENIQETVKNTWSSFDVCDKWLEREVHAIASSDLAYVTISEYMGLVSICLVSRFEYDDIYYDDDQRKANMSKGFCKRIAPKFEKLFGELICVGRFSNGEAIFEKISHRALIKNACRCA